MTSEKALAWVRWTIVALIIAGTLLTVCLVPAHAQGPNADFEDGWYYYWGWGTKYVPEGWTPFWAPWQREPEFKQAWKADFPARVHSGQSAAQWFTWSANHTGGLWQQWAVPVGASVEASAWFQAWASTRNDPASNYGGSYYTWIGIDPTGGTDWAAETVVWSLGVKHWKAPGVDSYDWVSQSVTVQAPGGKVTIFLKGWSEWPSTNNNCYVDDVVVTWQAPPTPQPTITPTLTIVPAITPTSAPIPTVTPTNEPTLTPTPAIDDCQLQILGLEALIEDLNQRVVELEGIITGFCQAWTSP